MASENYAAVWQRQNRAMYPERYRERARARYAQNRERILAQVKDHQDRNRDRINERKRKVYHSQSPEEKRRRALRTLYGLELEDYERMYVAQQGKCAICLQPHERLSVDHDHSNGEIRGLLCQKCNHAIGLLDEDHARFLRAVEYLGKGKSSKKGK